MKRCLFLVLALSACAAQVPWVNSRVPPDQWDKDWSACKRAAEYHAGGMRDWEDPNRMDPLAEYDRQHASSQIADEVSSCMIGRGYVPKAR